MHRYTLPLVALFFVGLNVLAAETKPVTGKAEAAVDRTVDKYKKADVPRFWVTPELLMFWSKDGPVKDTIILRTTDGSNPVLTNPVAQRIFNNDDQDYGMQLGGRLTFGLWVDDARQWGFELGGFALEEKEARWHYTAATGDQVALSFLNATTGVGVEGRWQFKDPGQTGDAEVRSTTQLWGVEGLGLYNLRRSENLTLDGAFGVRCLDLSEEFLWKGASSLPRTVQDEYQTHNRFYGAKLGVKLSYTAWERLLLTAEPSLSLGAMDEALKVRGFYARPDIWPTGAPPGGYLAIEPVLGEHSKTKFAVVPEVKVGVGCKITKNLSFNVAYNLLYVSDVVRPGEQPNRRINPAHSPGNGPGGFSSTALPNEPKLRFRTTDYWAQGLGLNLKIQF